MTRKRVLFVDDDPNVLQGLQRMLRPFRHEWEMRFANGAQEALLAMSQAPVDVLVTDMRMPGMDGAELLAEVVQRYPQTIRIALSGQTDKELALRITCKAHQFLAKPCDATVLRGTIVRALALRELLASKPLEQLVTGLHTIPSMPALYEAISAELQSPDASLARVGEIIASDLGMTAKILQLVNSAFFGLRRHVSNPAQAASLLGLEMLKALVLSIHVFSMIKAADLPGFTVEALWQHSLVTARLAQRIAETLESPRTVVDDSFMAGMLHDAGRLILAGNLPEQYAKVCQQVFNSERDLLEAEREIFGASHEAVGAYLLGLWALPDNIIEAIAFHHTPSACPSSSFSPLTAVHVANVLSRQADSSPIFRCAFDTAYLDRIGMSDRLESWSEIHDILCGVRGVQ